MALQACHIELTFPLGSDPNFCCIGPIYKITALRLAVANHASQAFDKPTPCVLNVTFTV